MLVARGNKVKTVHVYNHEKDSLECGSLLSLCLGDIPVPADKH